tara:strand:- start:36365 stop:39859 length:3495 start_codon:yes stop_codon:yes gene_type:complete
MKKILNIWVPIWYRLPKYNLRMKLTTLFLIISFFRIEANTYSQNTRISMDLDSVHVRAVLEEIESLSEFKILANEYLLDKHQLVSAHYKDKRIDKILKDLFSGTQITFTVVGKQIVLRKMEPKKNLGIKVIPSVSIKSQLAQKKIGGIITDEQGTPLAGVNILKEGTLSGTQSDFDGQYLILAAKGDRLTFSYIGMVSRTITVGDSETIDVIMLEDSAKLDEVVLVGFGTQKKSSVVGAVETISPSELRVTSSNLTTALAGRVSGLISYQRSGEPGADNAEFFIRGVTSFGYKRDPLILIDGVELTLDDLSRLQTDDIASFSILKDATATAIYGARGANGIILVTTKSGVTGKVKISVRFENSFSSPTRKVDFADPITYMQLHNEAVRTRNPIGPLPYSESKIANTIAGLNPNVYPAVNWQEELFQDFTNNQKMNLNMSGGGSAVRYYLATSYGVDNGLLKVDKRNNFNNNIKLKRLTLRSNINIDLTNTTEAIVRFNGTFDDYIGPIDGGAEIYKKALRTSPVLYPKFFEPDAANISTGHILFGNSTGSNSSGARYLNPYADLVKGYRENSKTLLLSQIEIKQNLDMITRGLKARILMNTTRTSDFDIIRQYNPYFYEVGRYDKETDTYTLNSLNEETGTEYLNFRENTPNISTSFYLEGAIDYNRAFNEKHEVTGLLVYTKRSSLRNNTGSFQKSLPYRNLGVSSRLSYGYDSKYFGEFNFGYNGSERFSNNNRFGFFPSAGVSWAVSEESFFEPLLSVVSRLKLRASYGIVGNDAIGDQDDRFFYLSQVNLDNNNRGYRFGKNFDYTRSGVSIDRYANDKITWERAYKTNLGLEINFLNDKIKVLADVFREKRDNILMSRAFIPPSIGLESNVRANVGEAQSEGIDFSIDYNNSFSNDFWLTGRVNFTYARGEFKVFEEPNYLDAPWRSHPGQPINQQYGLIAERLFVDEEEVLNSPQQFGIYGAGDIKYHDLNNDGLIDDNDKAPIGFPTTPEIVYGFGFSMGYKNFDLSGFFQGSARSSFWVDPYATAPFIDNRDAGYENITDNNALLQVYADSHWSEANQDVYALWPRLSTTVNENNSQTSTWFMRNGAFLRFKEVELGFSFPNELIHKWHLSKFRMYLTGTNLLSISKFKLWDPEMSGNGLGYPVQRVFNFGMQITL